MQAFKAHIFSIWIEKDKLPIRRGVLVDWTLQCKDISLSFFAKEFFFLPSMNKMEVFNGANVQNGNQGNGKKIRKGIDSILINTEITWPFFVCI